MGPKAEPPSPAPLSRQAQGPIGVFSAEEFFAALPSQGPNAGEHRVGPIDEVGTARPSSSGAHLGGTGGVEREVEEQPPGEYPPPGAKLGRERVAGEAWDRELPTGVRTSAQYRLALFRVGQEDYQLVEMVWDGAARAWRERLVGEPDGFDVVEARLLDRAVEWMTP